MTDIIIIGAGPAGLSAAIYALRYGLSVIVFDKGLYGGQAAITAYIENYPAIQKISGIDFSTNIYEQAVALGAEIRFEYIDKISLKNSIKSVTTSEGIYESKTIIIANGAKRRKLDCIGEDEFTGKGVSYCATCDGAFFKKKDVAIVGGGNTALEDALFLSNICNKVYMIHRKDVFRGENILIDSIKSKKNIEIVYNYKVEKIKGGDIVSNLDIKNLLDNTIKNISVQGIFIAIGFEPDNSMFSDLIKLDKTGYIIADESCTTNIDGVYVAGDSRTKLLRQIITAASDGAISAFQAANYVNTQKI